MFAKKVLGVINSFEVASQRPPIFVSPVDDVLVDCCLCFAHRWTGMAPSYKEMSLQLRKRALGLLLSRLENYKIPHMGKESLWRAGRLPEVLHVTPAANAWLNPTMDDDSDQDSDDSGDEMLFPMSTATSTVAMDGEGGENAPTDGITTTGV